MSRLLILFQAFLLSIGLEVESAISVRKFVYQKDMSEYCRRRVMPSVFLGRHVVQSHTQILHFSQLEVPYSCFISVRTESGSNIILVVQLTDEKNLKTACEADRNQVMVYEMGETFGGYWGPLPESALTHDIPVKYYTQRTTTLPTPTEKSSSEEEYEEDEDNEEHEKSDDESTDTMPDKSVLRRAEKDFIVVEVPLVNVSGRMRMSDTVPEREHSDEIFDFIYDVTRKQGDRYDASMMPLVQFSIHPRQRGGERSGGDDDVPRFELDYDLGEFTPDPRLSFWNFSAALDRNKNRYNANRRLNFKKHKGHHFMAKGTPSSKRRPFSQRSFDIFTKRFVGKKQTSESRSDIEDFLEKFNNRSLQLQRAKEDGIEYKNISSMIHKIANSNDNFSAYLIPNQYPESKLGKENKVTRFNFGSYTRNPLPRPTKFRFGDHKKIASKITTVKPNLLLLPPMQSMTLEPIIERSSTDDSNIDKTFDKMIVQKWIDSTIEPITKTTLKEHVDDFNETEINSKISNVGARIEKVFNSVTSSFKSTDEISSKVTANRSVGTMVDHESWENVVQAASEMAVHLNNSAADVRRENNKNAATKALKKRHIQAIPIENVRPHGLSTSEEVVTTVEPMFNFADMQDFAQLVELQDDEIHGRIALRYIRRYVGETLFNICDNRETKNRHVFLFNSSRIVIALSNFTMKRMTVVATPARTLMSADARCPRAYLECQVSGARVCIDSMTACDGVPNCGAYDIYDEDRLRCGAAKGLQHNVCLAAFTFLAFLLTVFYTVHYWLKRCVPKVSDAFFIFMDGTENILYLDSIMRSPHETEDTSKMVYRGSLFGNDTESDVSAKDKGGFFAKFKKFFRRCSRRQKWSKGHVDDVCSNDFYLGLHEPKKMFSFTECEIQKMMGIGSTTADKLCQTGESLEIDCFDEVQERIDKARVRRPSKGEHNLRHNNIFPLSSLDDSRQVPKESELSMLRFMKEARSEAEKQSIEDKPRRIDRHDVACGEEKELYSTFYEPPTEPTADDMELPGPSGYQRKRIRFDENVTTTLSSVEVAETNEATSVPSLRQDTDEDEQHSAGRDFMRLFASKSKKSKKEKKTNTLKFV